ncbi:MAG: phosphopyruvate hydratase [Candidatus Zambryskibacteria bacterium RIFCSPLOWO2_02_FULL_39_26]|uniref:Enolase n=1 Tax=Candidatus Zambryskibacteria bacterium RIFCSPLOWO2_12_FULL_39_23 TaxID=1802776 RepID=A0A1G2USB0_9BACT|nr:MAG: phosphopyruvate hydratase [Candidatus Zambryskibacteria bacterium RIFCSPHIGHO2_02_39_10]OHB00284.1 MAG: phosphopyruvate hydratase [Candidatus Zambryskibacteria bacterium RIFCSPHIGHO2_12_FULL_39_47]OHB09660.1 MAG: phosphopyruvate hydratase [Candidatus Zambryskibacteria bacterium RIFCSPLOWO2_02_FULL_39_26]OHB12261.1 MAG: phosphopyruvate hydratase [Candidatus Zambryskibacteria bacterium RIFCSPLOWO2_12_FULL_39_23]
MSKVTSLFAKEVPDSRENPTVEVLIFLDKFSGKAGVPSGASTGAHEAFSLPASQAINNINNEIAKNIIGKEFNQKSLDEFLITLDGTKNKNRLGANAILAVSLAFTRTSSAEKGLELYEYIGQLSDNSDYKIPQPMFNIINGGKHTDNGLDIQEFMVCPIKFETIRQKIDACQKIIVSLKIILEDKGYEISFGDEGGFAPKLQSNEEALDLILLAIKNAGFSTEQVKLAIDVAASTFYKNGAYQLKTGGYRVKTREEMIDWYENLISKYPIISIEDGLHEEDFDGFSEMSEKLGDKIMIVGDDLTVTNISRIKTALEKKAINSVIIKPNQIGSLTETLESIALAIQNGIVPIVSHRSGETLDSFIADLAVGLGCPYFKSGSLVQPERMSKYQRLVEIENILQKK